MTQGPSTPRKVVNFSKAAAKHIAAGRPKATDAQVDERYAICLECPSDMFKDGVCLDMNCGCALKPSHKPGKNKLRWADQTCPNKHWGAV